MALNPKQQSLIFGALCAVVGAFVGLWVWRTAIGEGYEVLPPCAALASFLVGATLWWFLVGRSARFSIKRGLATGVLVAFLSHYISFYLMFLYANVAFWFFNAPGSSLGEPPLDPLSAIWGALALAFWSWLFYGWVTLPTGALLGALYSWWLRRSRG